MDCGDKKALISKPRGIDGGKNAKMSERVNQTKKQGVKIELSTKSDAIFASPSQSLLIGPRSLRPQLSFVTMTWKRKKKDAHKTELKLKGTYLPFPAICDDWVRTTQFNELALYPRSLSQPKRFLFRLAFGYLGRWWEGSQIAGLLPVKRFKRFVLLPVKLWRIWRCHCCCWWIIVIVDVFGGLILVPQSLCIHERIQIGLPWKLDCVRFSGFKDWNLILHSRTSRF